MKISILSDNRGTGHDCLKSEHGLSVLLQTSTVKILMDVGASGIFASNAGELGIELSDVDYVFLSHGHSDHVAGLETFLELNRKAKIIVSPYAMDGKFYSGRGGLHSISSDWPVAKMQGRTILVDKTMSIASDIHVMAGIPKPHPLPLGNRLLYVQKDGKSVQDDFCHEIAIYVGGILYTGCSHSGLENILEACSRPVHTVIGGFHLNDSGKENTFESESDLRNMAGRLIANYPDTTFYTGHCTGDSAFAIMKSVMGPRLLQFQTGLQFEA